MMAECLFQTGALQEAEAIFQTIPAEYSLYEQSLFRLAGLERTKGNEEKALSGRTMRNENCNSQKHLSG
jgi:hypothetical protein